MPPKPTPSLQSQRSRRQPLQLPATATGPATLDVFVATTFLERLGGLLLQAPLQPDEGFLLAPCNSVHMIGMRYAIDVVYLKRDGVICQCVPHLKPMRVSFCRGAHAALELHAGSIARFGLRCGMRLALESLAAGQSKRAPSIASDSKAGTHDHA